MLGGVAVPYRQGLLAHSDGDVVLHAVSDALLGPSAPATSAATSRYRRRIQGIDSRILLRDVFARVQPRRLCHRQPGCDHHRPGPQMAPISTPCAPCWPRICNVI